MCESEKQIYYTGVSRSDGQEPVSASNMQNTALYDNYSDNDLLKMYLLSDIQAEEQLLSRYSRLVRAIARTFTLSGLDSDDLIQEGMIGLLMAIRRFDFEKNVPFPAFAAITIKNRLINISKAQMTRSAAPLSTYLPFDENAEIHDIENDPALTALNKDEFTSLISELESYLSSFEKKTLHFFLQGYSVSEIADMLSKTPKSTENAITRIRKKARAMRKPDN